MPRTCGSGDVNGPSSAATASHPPAASTAARRVDALGEPGQADPRAEHDECERGQGGDGEQDAHQCGWAAWSHQPAARTAPAVAAGASSERYRHAHRARITPTGTGNGLSMTMMGCRPARRARRVCLRICR